MPTYLLEFEDGRKFRVKSKQPLTTEEATASVLKQLGEQDLAQGRTSSFEMEAVTPTSANSPSAPEMGAADLIFACDRIGPNDPISDVRILTEAYMQSFDNGTPIEACFGINLLNGVSNAFRAPLKALSVDEGGSLHEGLGGRIPNSSVGHPAVQVAGVLPLIILWIAVIAWIHKLRRQYIFGSEGHKALSQDAELRGGPVGVGGWLKFFGLVMLIVSPLLILARALTFAQIIAEARQLDSFAQAESMKGLLYAHMALALVFASAAPIVGWRILKAKADALLWLRRFWGAVWAWQIGFILLFATVNPFPVRWRIDWWSVIVSLTGYFVWRLYFKRSRRVANTFGHWRDAAYRDTTFLHEIWRYVFPKSTETQSLPSAPVDDTIFEPDKDASQTVWAPPPVPEPAVMGLDDREKKSPSALDSYSQLAQEIKDGYRHQGLWLLCLTECDGDEAKAIILYYRRRAEMIQQQQEGSPDASTQ